MKEPNFGEGQLQQVVNTAFTQFAIENHRVYACPIIPTTVAEYGLGWDTGFYFPWLGYAPLVTHKGCNFFIQYKHSILIEGSRGGQWSDWNEEYFRFKIPHTIKNGKNYVTDYHQFDLLKLLSENDCDVYYATNHVTLRDDLFSEASLGVLLDNIPFLDVRGMTNRHYYATFTKNSDHFYLHSDPVKIPRLSGTKALDSIVERKETTLTQGNEQLLSCLEILAEHDRSVLRYIEKYQHLEKIDFSAPEEFRTFAKFQFLRIVFRAVVGAIVYRI